MKLSSPDALDPVISQSIQKQVKSGQNEMQKELDYLYKHLKIDRTSPDKSPSSATSETQDLPNVDAKKKLTFDSKVEVFPAETDIGEDEMLNIANVQRKHKKERRRSSFYLPSSRVPISPYQKDFKIGDNIDIKGLYESDEEMDVHAEDLVPITKKAQISFMDKQKQREIDLGTNETSNPKTIYKRQALPATTKWDGNIATLEDFISGVEGHVYQQQYMAYLLMQDIISLWLYYGNHQVVINIG